MGWTDYLNPINDVKALLNPLTQSPDAGIEAERKRMLQANAARAGEFADSNQEQAYALGQRGNTALDYMQGQMQGQNSVSALQLQQALQQQLAQQQAFAASASPQNAAMAARTAAIQGGRLGAGLAGQQAMAGLAERNQAAQQYAQLLQGLRGQDVNAALGSRQNAISGYGSGAFGAPAPSFIQQVGPAAVGGLGAAFGGGAPAVAPAAAPAGWGGGVWQDDGLGNGLGNYGASDRRLKKRVRSADDDASEAASKLPAFAYAYKDKRFGEGKQLGPMAQDLEKAGLGHTVLNTPGGKVVHGAKLALANTAMVSAMARRLDSLEKKAG